MARLLTVYPGFIPEGYFDEDNISFIQNKIVDILGRRYKQQVLIDRASVIRVMQRVLSEKIETIPKMNQRVLMYLANDVMNHQEEVNKHLHWEENSFKTLQLVNLDTMVAATDVTYGVKFANRLGVPKVGNTVRFYFT
jgi:hypothetical protein